MAIVDILTVLTHNSGQVLTTVAQSGLYGVSSVTRTIGAITAGTGNFAVVFLTAFLKGIS